MPFRAGPFRVVVEALVEDGAIHPVGLAVTAIAITTVEGDQALVELEPLPVRHLHEHLLGLGALRREARSERHELVELYLQSRLRRIVEVALKSTNVAGGVADVLTHLPMHEDALQKSVLGQVDEALGLEGFQGGYDNWLDAYEGGNVHVYFVSLADALTRVEEAQNQ